MDNNRKNEIIFSILSVFSVCFFPIVFLYTQNVGEASAKEMFIPAMLIIGLALVLGFSFYFYIKSISKLALVVSILIILFMNYTLLEKLICAILPMLRYWHIAPILIVAFLHLAYFIKINKPETINQINIVLSIVFCGLILFNLFLALPTMCRKTFILSKSNSEKEVNYNTGKNYPNIYYILLDEYSSLNSIKKYYGYDNTAFAKVLEDEKFTVSYGSHNESIDTITITTNNVNLDYLVTDNMIQAERLSYGKNPKIFRLANQYGYEIVNMSSHVSWNGTMGGVNNERHERYGAFLKTLLTNSIIYPFLSASDENAYRENVLSAFSQLQQTQENSKVPILTYAHIECPHTPFVFDEKGNRTDFSGLQNWKDHSYYLNQYKYITHRVEETVKTIIKNDPDSIIILQSDHSARWTEDITGKQIVENNDARSILNAVYYMGENMDQIKDKSAVNTLRLVFSKLFDINLPTVEVPAND